MSHNHGYRPPIRERAEKILPTVEAFYAYMKWETESAQQGGANPDYPRAVLHRALVYLKAVGMSAIVGDPLGDVLEDFDRSIAAASNMVETGG